MGRVQLGKEWVVLVLGANGVLDKRAIASIMLIAIMERLLHLESFIGCCQGDWLFQNHLVANAA